MTHITPSGTLCTIGASSALGQRENNEDVYGWAEFTTLDGRQALLLVVADGVGGQSGGERASELAKEAVLGATSGGKAAASDLPTALKEAFTRANEQICQEATTLAGRRGMATTCTAAALVGERLYLAHVGDTRLYLIRQGVAHQLTIDHTWAEEAIAAGRDPMEVHENPNRGVLTRYLGNDRQVTADTRYRQPDAPTVVLDSATEPLVVQASDSLLLCSDGVGEVLPPEQLARTIVALPPDRASAALTAAAVKVGGPHADNATALVVDLGARTRRRSPRLLVPALGALALAVALGAGALWWRGRQVTLPAPEAPATPPTTVAAAVMPQQRFTPTVTLEGPPPAITAAIDATGSTPMALAGGEERATLVPTHAPQPTVAPPTAPPPTATPSATPTSAPLPTVSVVAEAIASPADGGTLCGGTQMLAWQCRPLAEGETYRVRFRLENEATWTTLDAGSSTSARFPRDAVTQGGRYSWEVHIATASSSAPGAVCIPGRSFWFQDCGGGGGGGGGGDDGDDGDGDGDDGGSKR